MGLTQGWESDWSSSGARRGFHVPGETQEGGHWPCPLVKVDGDSGSSCGHHVEPGNNPIFPRIPVEGPLSPSRGDFPKGMPPQLGPGRELEFGMVPSGMKGDVSLNVSMGSNSQMIPQKMREAGAGPEEMLKLRAGGADMLPAQQKMVPLPFGKICHSFVSRSICHEVMEPDIIIFVF